MQLVRHHWEDRWKDRLYREFKFKTIQAHSLSADSIKYTLYCSLLPEGHFGDLNKTQRFRVSAELTATLRLHNPGIWKYECGYALKKRREELLYMLTKVLESGYVYDGFGKLYPIQENWCIEDD